MHVIHVRNVHEALPEALYQLEVHGVPNESRNGNVIQFPRPVCTQYDKPLERVIFWKGRDANPFFHFMEALWMLAGRNDVSFPSRIVSSMRDYSDDGTTFHGAYGDRWKKHFKTKGVPLDQLRKIGNALHENPQCRRQVLTMWDPTSDLGRDGKDLPCNTHAYFTRTVDGALDMTLCCRSNDLLWGAYGANPVHFSMLQEYLARWIDCEVGTFYQISNNLHLYGWNTTDAIRSLVDEVSNPTTSHNSWNPYVTEEVIPSPLIGGDYGKGSTAVRDWDRDLLRFLRYCERIVYKGIDYSEPQFEGKFFKLVAQPMWEAIEAYKDNRWSDALEFSGTIGAQDWRVACRNWVMKRVEARTDNGQETSIEGTSPKT